MLVYQQLPKLQKKDGILDYPSTWQWKCVERQGILILCIVHVYYQCFLLSMLNYSFEDTFSEATQFQGFHELVQEAQERSVSQVSKNQEVKVQETISKSKFSTITPLHEEQEKLSAWDWSFWC